MSVRGVYGIDGAEAPYRTGTTETKSQPDRKPYHYKNFSPNSFRLLVKLLSHINPTNGKNPKPQHDYTLQH